MKFNVSVELDHVSGPTKDAETMLDCFAATVGRENGARSPLQLEWTEWTDDGEERTTVYEVKMIDA
jgi:hypothetical protein